MVAALGVHSTTTAASIAFTPDATAFLAGDLKGSITLWRLNRPQEYRQFDRDLAAARNRLRADPNNGEALTTLGRWYAFRVADAWAAEIFEQARTTGANVSSLMLARCYWKLNRLDDAEREFQLALELGEAPAEYLRLCIVAVKSTDGSATLMGTPHGAGSGVAVGANR